jgi:hypothetical protein
MRHRISQILAINTLSCIIGVLIAFHVAYLSEHWGVVLGLAEEVRKCVGV